MIQSLSGPVTTAEAASFRSFMAKRPLPTTSLNNALAYGSGGTDTEALGEMYQITDDSSILDRMIEFTDRMLSLRNDPNHGRVMWTTSPPTW